MAPCSTASDGPASLDVRRRAASSVPAAATVLLWLVGVGPILAQTFVEETSFRFPVPNPAEYTNQLTIGDLDGDGDLDLVFANGQSFSVAGFALPPRVFINNGFGVFHDETGTRVPGVYGWFRGVELGDCDNDGDLDVVLAQDFDHLPLLLINDGAGHFTSEGLARLPQIVLSSSRGQFGDVDNDGDLDLFFTSGTGNRFGCGQYRLYLNDGTCHFTDATATNVPIANLCQNMDCLFGDIDGDFDLDIRTAALGANASRLYRNDGSGVFTFVSGVPPDGSAYSYDFGDLNGDGDLDLIGVNAAPASSAELLLDNDGTGAYSDVSGRLSPDPNEDDNDSKFFDYDDDGDLDLIIARLGGEGEKIYENDGAGNFTLTSGLITAESDSSLDVMVADLTGDGAPDIVTAQGESGDFRNRIYISHGAADTLPPRIVGLEQVISASPAGEWVARAEVLDDLTSDRNFFDGGITLHYTIDGGSDHAVAMRYSGGQVYRGVFGHLPGNSTIAYSVTAADRAGNVATGSSTSFLTPDCSAVGDCSGHGSCVGTGACACEAGWVGPDCAETAPVAGGAVPEGTGAADEPLRVDVLPNGKLELSWDPGCGAADEDYAVYQGSLAAPFSSHEPLTCSTSRRLSYSFNAAAGDLYFLVVPTTSTSEGSYGVDGGGNQRPAGAMACAPQFVEACQ